MTGWRRLWCTCSTCESARTLESAWEEMRTSDHRGLAHRRSHRAVAMPIDRLVSAAHAMRADEDWWFTPPYNELADLTSASISGEILEAR